MYPLFYAVLLHQTYDWPGFWAFRFGNYFYIAKLEIFDMNPPMKRKQFTTTIEENALKNIKKLAIDLDKPVNMLLEEAIKWLLEKYKKKIKE